MIGDIPTNLRRAINYLSLEQEFFAALLFEMQLVEVTPENMPQVLSRSPFADPSLFKMGTDGQRIYWSRSFVESISYPEVAFALAHEICHPMLMHLTRVYEHGPSGQDWKPKTDSLGRLISRNPALFNMAGDYIINDMLKEAHFHLCQGVLLDPKYSSSKGWTTERVYDDLLKNCKVVEVPSPGCDLVEPSSDTNPKAFEEEWKEKIIRAAAVARSQGRLPSSIEALVKEISEPQYPVWLLLANYVDSVVRADDYSWYRPNPHYLPHGIVMPGTYSERVSRVDLWYDTSGSVSDHDLSRFHRVGGDIIRNASPAIVALGQCDADVHSYQEFRQGQDWTTSVKVTGRGGTSFVPPFDYLRDHRIVPSVLVYLTDLAGTFPTTPPPYPVLWVSVDSSRKAPFGTTLYL